MTAAEPQPRGWCADPGRNANAQWDDGNDRGSLGAKISRDGAAESQERLDRERHLSRQLYRSQGDEF